jgi:5S rRNA maturation endonuclease (ribonuclease M5)
MTVETVLNGLRGAKRVGTGWQALCPAHPDKNPSLSINVREGNTLIHCHAGCSQDAVLKALGIEPRELFSGVVGENKHLHATYDYLDEDGVLLYQVLRYQPKAFSQRRPDGNGGWNWNLAGVRRVLYRLPEVIAADDVLLCEGEKDCETARGLGLVATCNSAGAGKWSADYVQALVGKDVTIIADRDEPGRRHAQRVAASLAGKVQSLKVVEFEASKDLSEWVESGGNREALATIIGEARPYTGGTDLRVEVPLVVVSAEDLLTREIKPREMLLDPVLPEQGLMLLYAYRGIGKTFLALGMAAAVASGSSFLRWKAPKARRVLYVDGEMPGKTMQERIAMVIAGVDGDEPPADFLRLVTPDFQNRSIPDLSTIAGQKLVEAHLQDVNLIVLDNLSALCRSGNENEGESWLPVQDWALALRRQGISILFVHHAGKNKAQRGTSKREDLLDTVMTLKHSSNYNPSDGLRCEVHFEKTRGMFGDAAKPFEVRLHQAPDGKATWSHSDLEDLKATQAGGLFATGMSVRDVAEELGISKSAAGRYRQGWRSALGTRTVPAQDGQELGQWDS